MTYSSISHEKIGKYIDQVPKYVICANLYKIKDYQYNVTSCNKKRKKTYAYVVVKYVNYRGGHLANSHQCTSRHKTEADTCKKKN